MLQERSNINLIVAPLTGFTRSRKAVDPITALSINRTMKMRSNVVNSVRFLTGLACLLIFCLQVQSQQSNSTHRNDALMLTAMARHLWAPVELQAHNYALTTISPSDADLRLRQATLLLQAAVRLDETSEISWHDLLSLFITNSINDPGRATDAVIRYSSLVPRDAAAVEDWFGFRLNRLNDRESRELFLNNQIGTLQDYPHVQSNALTQLAILDLEKGDIQNARERFGLALEISSYNIDALIGWGELPQPVKDENPDQNPNQDKARSDKALEIDLHRLRRQIANNPYNLQATLNLIQFLDDHRVYRAAQTYYNHALTLLSSQSAADDQFLQLQLNQLAGAYSAELYDTCLVLARNITRDHPDNLLAIALHAGALKKLEKSGQAKIILENAAKSVSDQLTNSAQPNPDLDTQLAWFYCFAHPNPTLALKHAQSAFKTDPKKPRLKYLLAYALLSPGRFDQSQDLLNQSDPTDPIAALAWAKTLIAKNEKKSAYEKLAALPTIPKGLLAEEILTMIKVLTQDIQSTDPDWVPHLAFHIEQSVSDNLERHLQAQFDDKDLLLPTEPEKFIRCTVKPTHVASTYRFGDPILAKLTLTNISDITLVLGPDSFLDPHLLIYARLVPRHPGQPLTPSDEGDSATNPYILIAHRNLNQQRILASGSSNTIHETFNIGSLRDQLESHPFTEYRITFRFVLDPIADSDGNFVSRIPAIQPRPLTITRKAFVPTKNNLAKLRRSMLSKSPDVIIRTTDLLAHLVNMPRTAAVVDSTVLTKWITDNLTHSEPRVRAWSAFSLQPQSIAGSTEAQNRIAQLLNDPDWFARFCGTRTLNHFTDLREYYEWIADNEEDLLLKQQANGYLHKPWQIIPVPPPQKPPTPSTDPPIAKDAAGSQ